MQELTVAGLKEWQASGKTFLLVDVREAYEHDDFNIGGMLLPLGRLMPQKDEIPMHIPVVLYCEKGIRSVIALQRLEAAGYTNLYNLQGGMKAFKAADNT